MSEPDKFESWAIVELMGHVRLGGKVTEEERFGSKMGRIDIPQPDGSFVTQYFGGGSVYRLTPCTEEMSRVVAAKGNHEPVYAWDIRRVIEGPKEPINRELDPHSYDNNYDEPDY